MKKLLVVAALLTSTFASAELINSEYNARQNTTLENGIEKECGQFKSLEVLSSKKERVVVDQGIVDYKFTTVLYGKQKYEQNIYDKYTVTVVSWYYDGYDHASGENGWYHVESVVCEEL
ncbi:hypothetical protein M899_0954 [Bacteriovorax sp. BSW11_IV]|uniref:hypothetical protein n=1 Tax=Bacteriovorax sp. BSW11_IV TaxID=1353529 RepID=UPI000389E97F|nr:hypothetical protein [Bacteriovorax sp. BSW11_IV]EQC48635.1 hypothetical protein M899_0954 [Bacteriovorax sp. BSW11_IV]